MRTVLLPPGDNPIAVNKYILYRIISYHIVSYRIISYQLLEYKRNWIQHVNRMPRNWLPREMKHYSPTGRRNYGRPLKRLLDTSGRNVSTSGPTPWQIYDDDHHHHHIRIPLSLQTFFPFPFYKIFFPPKFLLQIQKSNTKHFNSKHCNITLQLTCTQRS